MSAVLVEYFVDEDTTTLVGVRDGLRPELVTVPVAEQQLERYAEHALAQDSADSVSEADLWKADDLAELVLPLVHWTEPGDHVVVIPHSALHAIPLHAIWVDGSPLIDRNPVSFAPSTAALIRCRERPREDLTRALILADSLGDLPHARIEGRGVAKRFRTEPVEGAEATRARLGDALRHAPVPQVLHLACHGEFLADDAEHSKIALAGGGSREAPVVERAVDLTAAEVARLNAPAQLVVLSACESGLVERRAGDEPFGLVRAFLLAGAKTIVVSGWTVDDVSTWLLMERFYDELLAERDASPPSKAEALRRAQMHVRNLSADAAEEAIERCRSSARAIGEAALLDYLEARVHAIGGRSHDATVAFREGQVRASATAESSFSRSLDRARNSAEAMLTRRSADLTTRPFEDPYYWAAFSVVGDWT